MAKILIIISVLALTIELIYRPRLDYTRDGKRILWYGRKSRRYIVLSKF